MVTNVVNAPEPPVAPSDQAFALEADMKKLYYGKFRLYCSLCGSYICDFLSCRP